MSPGLGKAVRENLRGETRGGNQGRGEGRTRPPVPGFIPPRFHPVSPPSGFTRPRFHPPVSPSLMAPHGLIGGYLFTASAIVIVSF
jgi:hypothetical protein